MPSPRRQPAWESPMTPWTETLTYEEPTCCVDKITQTIKESVPTSFVSLVRCSREHWPTNCLRAAKDLENPKGSLNPAVFGVLPLEYGKQNKGVFIASIEFHQNYNGILPSSFKRSTGVRQARNDYRLDASRGTSQESCWTSPSSLRRSKSNNIISPHRCLLSIASFNPNMTD